MMELEFAVTPPSDITAAVAWLEKRQQQDSHWILVDAALLDPRDLERVLRSRHFTSHSAYLDPLSAYGSSAPCLVECDADEHTAELLGALMKQHGGSVATSVLRVNVATRLEDVQRALSYLALVWIEQRKEPIHCRVADARVFPSLTGILSETQLASAAQTVNAWGWFDRVGMWRHVRLPKPVDCGLTRLCLDIVQFRAMQASAEADGVFTLLLDTTPELVPDRQRGEFHGLIVGALANADARSVSRPEDRLRFVSLSLSCGPTFHLHPSLEPTWLALGAGRATLEQEMATWSDEIWNSLESCA